MRTVITYGTFDLFHVGHVKLLERLAQMGDRLIVGVSTDQFNAVKGKRAIFSFEERVRIISSVRYVTEVFAEENWEQKPADIKRFNADVFAIGQDWQGKFDDLRSLCEVAYVPRTENVSSTALRKQIRDLTSADFDRLISQIDLLREVVVSLKN